jgi:hypothetical protein
VTKRKETPKPTEWVEPLDFTFNSAFLKAVEARTLNLLRTESREDALKFLSNSMRTSLTDSFKNMGAPALSGKWAFKKYVAEVDKLAGLRVEFIDNTNPDGKFEYIMHNDAFPKLNNIFDVSPFSVAEIGTKINYFLGPEWSYIISKHVWNDEDESRYLIYKSNPDPNWLKNWSRKEK